MLLLVGGGNFVCSDIGRVIGQSLRKCSSQKRTPASNSAGGITAWQRDHALAAAGTIAAAFKSSTINDAQVHMMPSCPAQSSIAVLRLDNPPVNALSHSERTRLLAELTCAEEDAAIGAIVLIGNV